MIKFISCMTIMALLAALAVTVNCQRYGSKAASRDKKVTPTFTTVEEDNVKKPDSDAQNFKKKNGDNHVTGTGNPNGDSSSLVTEKMKDVDEKPRHYEANENTGKPNPDSKYFPEEPTPEQAKQAEQQANKKQQQQSRGINSSSHSSKITAVRRNDFEAPTKSSEPYPPTEEAPSKFLPRNTAEKKQQTSNEEISIEKQVSKDKNEMTNKYNNRNQQNNNRNNNNEVSGENIDYKPPSASAEAGVESTRDNLKQSDFKSQEAEVKSTGSNLPSPPKPSPSPASPRKPEFKDTKSLRHHQSDQPISTPSQSEARSGPEDTTTCKGRIRDPTGHMSQGQINQICGMYDAWSGRMRNGTHWKPTKKQINWFGSLGVQNRRRRRKRQVQGKSIRREYRMMTDNEREAYHRAINTLKTTFVDGVSKYDVFVQYHQPDQAPEAHFGPAFYSFHREMVFRFENALKEVDPSVSLPYWDANLDQLLGNHLAAKTIMWTDRFFGNGNGPVTSGPFANWKILYASRNGQTVLNRALDEPVPPFLVAPALVSDEAILTLMSARSMRDISWNIDNRFESHHGGVHNYVGGVMSELSLSAADPIFFPLHAFFDCLWEQFRQQQLTRLPLVDPRYDYPNDSEALGVGLPQPNGQVLNRVEDSPHYATAPLRPFTGLRNIDGLSFDYTNYFYECEASPVCSEAQPDCGSPNLFCERTMYRCVPKLAQGAQCQAYANFEPCFESVCCRGVCSTNCGNNINNNNNNRGNNNNNNNNRGQGQQQFFREGDGGGNVNSARSPQSGPGGPGIGSGSRFNGNSSSSWNPPRRPPPLRPLSISPPSQVGGGQNNNNNIQQKEGEGDWALPLSTSSRDNRLPPQSSQQSQPLARPQLQLDHQQPATNQNSHHDAFDQSASSNFNNRQQSSSRQLGNSNQHQHQQHQQFNRNNG